MGEYKVIVDTCVLISASINHSCVHIPGKIITEKFYRTSKSLLDYFKTNSEKKEGLVLEITVNKARNKISEIVERNIDQINTNGQLNLKLVMDEKSMALFKIQNSLNEHISFLEIITFSKDNLKEIKGRVKKFYNSVPNIIGKNDPEQRIKFRVRRAGPFKDFERKWAKQDEASNFHIMSKLKNKFNNDQFDEEDMDILAHAIFIKKELNKEHIIYIASTDYHFSRVLIDGELSTLIPEHIETRFHIKCDWPEKILADLIKNI